MSNPQTTTTPPGSHALLVVLIILCLAGAGGYYGYVVYTSKPTPVDELNALRGFISKISETQKLGEAYRDSNNDLVADAPADAAKSRKVDEITFSPIAGDDAEKAQQAWKDLVTALEKATGKKVTYRSDFESEEEQLRALREGKLHITTFSTGEVPMAVNKAGFVPLVTIADAEGKYSYEMEILVPASSSVTAPAGLKGKTVAFTSLSSNSGAKAPMVILKQKFSLLPGRDYKFVQSGGHAQSIKGLAEGKYDAICVANDLLARAVAAGDIKKEQFRSIHKSESFPPLCIGVAHDLAPELVGSVKKALEGFRFEGTSLEKQYSPQGKVRFAMVDYKRDWAYVRDIDDSLTRLLDAK